LIRLLSAEDHPPLTGAQCVKKRAAIKAEGEAESGGAGVGSNVAGFGTPGNDAWTHGTKNVLYMRVNFPDDLTEPLSEAAAYATMDSVNTFYTECSYDLTSLTATVTPLLTLPPLPTVS